MNDVNSVRGWSRILVGVDESSDAQQAFAQAIVLAKSHGAALFIVSVLENHTMNVYQTLDRGYVQRQRDDLERYLEKYRDQALSGGVQSVKTLIAESARGEMAGETIVTDVIAHVHPDLLVIGAKSRRGLAKHFGSQAAYMAKYAPISVLVVR